MTSTRRRSTHGPLLSDASFSELQREIKHTEHVRSYETVQSCNAVAIERQNLDRLRCVPAHAWGTAVQTERRLCIRTDRAQPEGTRARWAPRRLEKCSDRSASSKPLPHGRHAQHRTRARRAVAGRRAGGVAGAEWPPRTPVRSLRAGPGVPLAPAPRRQCHRAYGRDRAPAR
jgi:hypothetical protein